MPHCVLRIVIGIYNIASRAAQSNSIYVRVLQISIVHSRADGVSKSLCQKFFSREQPLLAWGKIFRYSATIMDRNRDSNHHSFWALFVLYKVQLDNKTHKCMDLFHFE